MGGNQLHFVTFSSLCGSFVFASRGVENIELKNTRLGNAQTTKRQNMGNKTFPGQGRRLGSGTDPKRVAEASDATKTQANAEKSSTQAKPVSTGPTLSGVRDDEQLVHDLIAVLALIK